MALSIWVLISVGKIPVYKSHPARVRNQQIMLVGREYFLSYTLARALNVVADTDSFTTAGECLEVFDTLALVRVGFQMRHHVHFRTYQMIFS